MTFFNKLSGRWCFVFARSGSPKEKSEFLTSVGSLYGADSTAETRLASNMALVLTTFPFTEAREKSTLVTIG